MQVPAIILFTIVIGKASFAQKTSKIRINS